VNNSSIGRTVKFDDDSAQVQSAKSHSWLNVADPMQLFVLLVVICITAKQLIDDIRSFLAYAFKS